ncbi:hypothetical protein, partial [Pseudomonas aeruginosa]
PQAARFSAPFFAQSNDLTMFHANCPACGAPVELKSAAAVMAVCSFCKSTLLRDGETLSDIGKMSAVLEDYARVQIGTTGRYKNKAFT